MTHKNKHKNSAYLTRADADDRINKPCRPYDLFDNSIIPHKGFNEKCCDAL